jgi:hypothetical protein
MKKTSYVLEISNNKNSLVRHLELVHHFDFYEKSGRPWFEANKMTNSNPKTE